MALEFGNRIAVSTSTTGTGTVTLGSAVSDAFMTFAEGGITDGATVHYLITEGNDFEIGTGTYTSSGTTLSRDTVIDSKISGTAGTTKMTLGGSAEVRVISTADDVGADVQVFEASGTWSKPDGAIVVDVTVIGAGGGGGSGARYASVAHGGGGGGEGGGVSRCRFRASDLGLSVSVTVGAGGTGGAAVTTNDTNGNGGADGGDSSFGTYLTAGGGDGGGGGAGSGGGGGSDEAFGTETPTGGNDGVTGARNSTEAVDFVAKFPIRHAPFGGIGGGGIDASNVGHYWTGFNSLLGTSSTPPAFASSDGAAGANATIAYGYVWFGGSGGAFGITTAAGAGGDGYWGSGGGGGGASVNGYNTGAGGDGGDGVVIVVSYLGNAA